MKLKDIESTIQSELNVGWRVAKNIRDILFKHWSGYKEAIQDLSVRYDDDGRIEFTLTVNNKQRKITI